METKICSGPFGIFPNGNFAAGATACRFATRFPVLISPAGRFAACIKPRTSADAGVAAKNAQAENPQTMAQAAPALAGNPCNSDKAILFAWKLLNRSSPNRSSPSRRETQPKLGILMELTA